jgi:hypothetical protein
LEETESLIAGEFKKTGVELQGTSIPPQLKEQLEAGGLIPYLKKKAGIAS